MITGIAFVIGVTVQALAGIQHSPALPFDYEPPRTVRKIRPCKQHKERVIYYPENQYYKGRQ